MIHVHAHVAGDGLRLAEGREDVVDRAAWHLGGVERGEPIG